MTPVEKVGAAMADALNIQLTKAGKEEAGRAAIEALREPSEAMKRVGKAKFHTHPGENWETGMWRAMIDAALDDAT